MTIKDASTIDALGLDRLSGEAVLTVVDPLEWSDIGGHSTLLAEKLNRYFGFVESGEIYTSYPEARGRSLRIDIVCRFEPPSAAIDYLRRAEAVAGEYQCALSWRFHAG
ncbi:DUF6572 domain-containing protein [Roseateles sp. P5_D6]